MILFLYFAPPPITFLMVRPLKSISCRRPTPEPLTREERFCSLANFGMTTCLSPRLRNGVVVVVVVFLFFQKKDGVGGGGMVE